jgi:hypothetical protein
LQRRAAFVGARRKIDADTARRMGADDASDNAWDADDAKGSFLS